jgi:hypothetical protein
MKGEFCSHEPHLWCSEGNCATCQIPLDKILPIKLVTHVHCKCGWQGEVNQCVHKKDFEINEYGVEEIILDLCPDCLLKKANEVCVEYD